MGQRRPKEAVPLISQARRPPATSFEGTIALDWLLDDILVTGAAGRAEGIETLTYAVRLSLRRRQSVAGWGKLGLAHLLRTTYYQQPADGDGDHMSKKKYVETESAREKRLGENTEEKIASRQIESDALDERIRENIRQHGA